MVIRESQWSSALRMISFPTFTSIRKEQYSRTVVGSRTFSDVQPLVIWPGFPLRTSLGSFDPCLCKFTHFVYKRAIMLQKIINLVSDADITYDLPLLNFVSITDFPGKRLYICILTISLCYQKGSKTCFIRSSAF
jgi:hypothetical protein